jgi:hypothetical protein
MFSIAVSVAADGGQVLVGLPRRRIGDPPTCRGGCTRQRKPAGHHAGGAAGPPLANRPLTSLRMEEAKRMRWTLALENSTDGSGVMSQGQYGTVTPATTLCRASSKRRRYSRCHGRKPMF